VSEAASAARRGLVFRLVLLAAGLSALRLVGAALIPLTEDEAYYRLWAQHLAFGYFDHPPMIAWWIRLGTELLGDNPLGVRALSVVASGVNTWLIGDLARRLGFSERVAFRAGLWYNATLTVGLGGLLALPDSPASLFWTLTLWCLARAWADERLGWWVGAGAAAGLGVLSKYSALVLAPGVLVWLSLAPGGLARLRRPGPWLAAATAGAVFAVNIVWNAQNGWITFSKQFGRIAPGGASPAHLAEFLVTQALLLTPLVAVFAARGVGRAWRTRRAADGAGLLLPVATAAPFAIYLLLHSLHDRVQGHWPVPLFGALAIAAAAAAPTGDGPVARWLRWATPALGFSIAAAAVLLLALPAPTPLGTRDPTLIIRGWPPFAADVEALRARTGAAWVGTQSYGVYAQLEHAGRITMPLLQVIERDRYPRFGGRVPDFGQPGLIVDIDRRIIGAQYWRCFRSVVPVAQLGRAGGLGKNQHYLAYLVAGPKRDVWTQGCPAEIRPGVWR
jgi:4-amino-4-deoxy-L-arabinose transferase-like glycosyltransferase